MTSITAIPLSTKTEWFHALKIKMPQHKKLCISVPCQIGCLNKCSFCISANANLAKNLSAMQMLYFVEQALKEEQLEQYDTIELSFTGEGDALHNIYKVTEAVENSPDAVNQIKLSFSGMFSDNLEKYNSHKPTRLQFSLHSAIEACRKKLIPVSDSLVDIKRNILNNRHKFTDIVINYVVLKQVNDTAEHWDALKNFLEPDWLVTFNPVMSEYGADIQYNLQQIQQIEGAKAFSKIALKICNNQMYPLLTYWKKSKD